MKKKLTANLPPAKPTAAESRADFRKRKEAKDRFKRRQMTGKNR